MQSWVQVVRVQPGRGSAASFDAPSDDADVNVDADADADVDPAKVELDVDAADADAAVEFNQRRPRWSSEGPSAEK